MSDKNSFDLSNRVFALVALMGTALMLFFVFRMVQIWRDVNGQYAREITVEGEGSAFVVPDTATINLGVTTDADTSEAAVEENTAKMNAVLEAIKALGVTEENIQTTGYYLNPQYDWTSGTQETVGYTLTQNVEVRLTDFDLIGKVLADSSAAGANTVGGVEFVVDDPETAMAEARDEAVAKAKEKAMDIAEASGLDLGKVVNYYEYSNGDGKSYYPMYESSMMMDSSSTAPSIEAGQEEVSLTVTLTYRLR